MLCKLNLHHTTALIEKCGWPTIHFKLDNPFNKKKILPHLKNIIDELKRRIERFTKIFFCNYFFPFLPKPRSYSAFFTLTRYISSTIVPNSYAAAKWEKMVSLGHRIFFLSWVFLNLAHLGYYRVGTPVKYFAMLQWKYFLKEVNLDKFHLLSTIIKEKRQLRQKHFCSCVKVRKAFI